MIQIRKPRWHREEGDQLALRRAPLQGQGRQGEGVPGILQDGDGRAGPFHGKQKRGEELPEHQEATGKET